MFFSFISSAYKKEESLDTFIQAVLNQDYSELYELILVIDDSPDKCRSIAENFITIARTKNVDLKIINNPSTQGQCISRNTAIQYSRGDVVIVLDCDCIMDTNYLTELSKAYETKNYDVVIGPLNIETNGEDPYSVLQKCKSNIEAYDNPQDNINRNSFLNTVTRNFSVSRAFASNYLFDPLFSHIANDKSTGFGWEDIEMGYRLYKKGARIKYIPTIPTVHMTHAPSIPDQSSIPLRSLKNFRRLHEKHPEFFNITRRWSIDTYSKIKQWVKSNGKELNEDAEWLDKHFKDSIPYTFFIKKDKKLRILTYRWHTPHQYELYKLPYEFTLVSDLGTDITKYWAYGQRPFPKNARFKQIREINPNEYDLAIVHFDENVLNPENTNNIIRDEWGQAFRYFIQHINIPKIGICHGTPQFYGAYNRNYTQSNKLDVIESSRKNLVNFVGDNLIICNSHQAWTEWGFKNSKWIWHGMDPTEYYGSIYRKKVLALTNMLERPHYRGQKLLEQVTAKLQPEYKPIGISVIEPRAYSNHHSNDYAQAKFNNYVKAVGEYSIYFNPTMRSPMPRSRTDAMMCGLAVVTAHNHDVDMFIKNGVNGFYSNNPGELSDYITFLCDNPDACKKIGNAGRKTACDIFNHDRYLYEWQETIRSVIR